MATTQAINRVTEKLTLPGRAGSELVAYATGLGHPDHPCLSRAHNPTSCVPCVDFSPWLRERVLANDVDAVGTYLALVRDLNPGVPGSRDDVLRHYCGVARAIMTAPVGHHLRDGTHEAYLDLRVGLVLLAVHEGFTGFIMTGEAADFMAAVMLPHSLRLTEPAVLVDGRNRFVTAMAREMSFWASWPQLQGGTLRALERPEDAELSRLIDVLAPLPLGARAHAVDAMRHLSADCRVPKTLASLSRYETRKRGLDVTDSTRHVLATGVVVPAENLEGWIGAWTRRDLLGFLHHEGVRARNSWSKERLAELALAESSDLLRRRMADAGVVELAPAYVHAVRLLRRHLYRVRETWRVWLGFGTGIA
jgi:hypothetical protein